MPSRVRVTESAVEEPRVLEAPSHEEIAARAYAVYQQRGEGHGEDLDDWLRAERELLLQRSGQASIEYLPDYQISSPRPADP